MNIGIDIDGVLTNIQNFNRRHAPQFFKRKYNLEVVDGDSLDIRDIFKCRNKQFIAYWRKYLLKYVTAEPPRKGAREFTRKLRKDGHVIFIISRRVFSCRKNPMGILMRKLVRRWLRRNGIRHHEVVFCETSDDDSKRVACINKQVDIMLEDEIVNINSIASVTNVICFDTSYNRGCEGENIHRVKNFEEAYKLIKRFKGISIK